MSVLTRSRTRSGRSLGGLAHRRRQRPRPRRLRRRASPIERRDRARATATTSRRQRAELDPQDRHRAARRRATSPSSARPREAGAGFAAPAINAADKGVTIDVIQGDSGDTDNKAYETTVPTLLGEGVVRHHRRRIVGRTKLVPRPGHRRGHRSSSRRPTPSLAFTGWDDNGMYWRTAPSRRAAGRSPRQPHRRGRQQDRRPDRTSTTPTAPVSPASQEDLRGCGRRGRRGGAVQHR